MQIPAEGEGLTDSIREAFARAWPNIGAAIDDRADRFPQQVGWMFPDKDGNWQEMSWSAFRSWAHRVAAGILSLGITPGDVASICAGTSMRWVVADMAMSTIGVTTNTIYPNTRTEDVDFILQDAESVAIFAQNAEIASRFLTLDPHGERIRRIVVMEGDLPCKDGMSQRIANRTGSFDKRLLTWADLEAQGASYLSAHPSCVRDAQAGTSHTTLATIIYTSGTTGRPKGVEMTHGNWIYEAVGWGANDSIHDRQIHYIWLPLSHGFSKCLLLISLYTGTINAIDGRVDKIADNLEALRPSLMCGVPRIFEKLYDSITHAAPENSLKGRLMKWAFRVGEQAFPYRSQGKEMPSSLARRYALADKLVFSTIRKKLGGRLDFLISGSAKLNPEIQRWFFNIGIPMLEGYGVTETAAVTYYNRVQELRFGSVGRIIPGSATRIDPHSGEILIKGPCVMARYHNDPELTSQVIDADGWFHTGDVGYLDEDRFLFITDRIKDFIKTSNGKIVAPTVVESVLTSTSAAIASAVVIGEGKKYCAALLSVDVPWLQKWCADHGYSKMSYEQACTLPELHDALISDVEEANEKLARHETIKKFAVIPQMLTAESGLATPTLKVRREKVLERYRDLAESLF